MSSLRALKQPSKKMRRQSISCVNSPGRTQRTLDGTSNLSKVKKVCQATTLDMTNEPTFASEKRKKLAAAVGAHAVNFGRKIGQALRRSSYLSVFVRVSLSPCLCLFVCLCLSRATQGNRTAVKHSVSITTHSLFLRLWEHVVVWLTNHRASIMSLLSILSNTGEALATTAR